jgi:hypothetical protein
MLKFLQENKVLSFGSYRIPWGVPDFYAQWPGIQILGAFTTRVVGLKPLTVAIFLPWFFALLLFLSTLVLSRRLTRRFGLDPSYVPIALTVLVTSPFVGEGAAAPIFKYQYAAAALAALLFYVFYSGWKMDSRAWQVLAVVILSAIAVTHHYTSFFVMALMIGTLFQAKVDRLDGRNMPVPSGARYLVLTGLAVILGWWIFVGVAVWQNVPLTAQAVLRAIAVFPGQLTITQALGGSFYGAPTPPLGMLVLLARDIVMFGSAIVGAAYMVRRFRPSFEKTYITAALIVIVFGLGLDLAATFGISNLRVLAVGMPFVSIAGAILWSNLARSQRAAVRYLSFLAVALFIFASLVGLWAHLYMPQHLYNPAVTWLEGGEHPTEWQRLEPLFRRAIPFKDLSTITTDDRYVLGLLVPPDYWDKIRVIGGRDSTLGLSSLVVSLRGLNPYSYVAQLPSLWMPFGTELSDAISVVATRGSVVYEDGRFRIWMLD